MKTANSKSTVLILYTELAAYTIASLKALVASGKANVHLVRWPVNAEAPFEFAFDEQLKVYDRKQFNEQSLVQLSEEIRPDLILCSGWNDKGYLAVCKRWRKRIPVVLAMDNKWDGNAKQQLARIVARFTILCYFSHCWVPGSPQKSYAEKLGFRSERIQTGFYTCDTDAFAAVHHATQEEKKKQFPHVFIYAGRYYDFKGVTEMWNAFARLKKETPSDWKMISLGVGDVPPFVHAEIAHEGFVQPEQLAGVMARSGVFILPSRFEPWAVVVQEFAAAGFPLLLSSEVGAADAFLEEGKNGFRFLANDEDAVLAAMQRITSLSDAALQQMGERSHALALQNTPVKWAATLFSFLA